MNRRKYTPGATRAGASAGNGVFKEPAVCPRNVSLNHAATVGLRFPKALAPLSAIKDVSALTLTGDELGWRLAGITDGEGCFFIWRSTARNSFACRFAIGVRADDRPLLELLQRSTGLGRIYDVRVTERIRRTRPGTKPQVQWTVGKRAECEKLVELFTRYPLISRKRLDCAVWIEAVAAWRERDWERMAVLSDAIRAARAYEIERAA